MTIQEKIRVAVLYGGRSGEHEVSLLSATSVLRHLDRSRFEVIPIGIDKQGNWFLNDDIFKKELTNHPILKVQHSSDRKLFNPNLIGKSLQEMPTLFATASQPFDVIFPVLHGVLCEDGTIQGLLESANIPYVGCGVLASAIGMDKDVSKRLIKNAGILTADYLVIKRGAWEHYAQSFCASVSQQFSFPVFVKPANTGSSVGVHKVKHMDGLKAAIEDAFRYDTKVIVEEGIDAAEIEVAVLESLEYGQDPIISVVGEVRPRHEFYSYAAKYLDENGAELIIPASIAPDLQEQARQLAKKIFTVLECEGLARVDLFVNRKTNELYFNEINTLPGFTQISMYPKLMNASGIGYSELLSHLILLAINRHQRKLQLSHEYVSEKEYVT